MPSRLSKFVSRKISLSLSFGGGGGALFLLGFRNLRTGGDGGDLGIAKTELGSGGTGCAGTTNDRNE